MLVFSNPAVIWFIAGFALFLLEFAVPGLILFFFAVGAWITSILLFFIDFSLDSQLLIFLLSSLASLFLFRRSLKKILWSKKQTSEIEDELIGKVGVAETVIEPGKNGKVDFKGTSWDAKSGERIERGEEVIIIGNESILLIVKPNKVS